MATGRGVRCGSPGQTRSTALARAKNTARSEARRRVREQRRAEDVEQDEAVDEPAAEAPRKPLFTPPNVRQDIRSVPAMFRERKLLWLPVLILLIGFGLTYALVQEVVPEALADAAFFYVYFLFIPQALFTFFIGGFLAPRAGYLVGFLLGLLNGLLWAVLAFAFGIGYSPEAGLILLPPELVADFSISYIVIGVLYGTLAAAFASWYRGFLRQMQERGRQRRAEREAKERAKRRDERRAARRGV